MTGRAARSPGTGTRRRAAAGQTASGNSLKEPRLLTLEDQCAPRTAPAVKWRRWRGDREWDRSGDKLVRVQLRCGAVSKTWQPASNWKWRHRALYWHKGEGRTVEVSAHPDEADHPGDVVGYVFPEDFDVKVANPDDLKGQAAE